MIIKILADEISIASANTVYDAPLVRIINTGATANLIISGIGNVSVTNTETIIVEKPNTSTLTGANMRAVPVAYKA
jgi:hypothetical protein